MYTVKLKYNHREVLIVNSPCHIFTLSHIPSRFIIKMNVLEKLECYSVINDSREIIVNFFYAVIANNSPYLSSLLFVHFRDSLHLLILFATSGEQTFHVIIKGLCVNNLPRSEVSRNMINCAVYTS